MKTARKMLVLAAALSLSGFAMAQAMTSAQGSARGPSSRDSYLSAELGSVSAELGDKPIGEMTLNEMRPFEERLLAAASKDAYVRSAAIRSLILPGLGQLRDGATAEGAGFLALHLAVLAGGIAGTYYLLPADLRFDKLDYLNTSISGIKSAWTSKSVADLLPALGVAAGSMMLDFALRAWSAKAASREAKAAVEAGSAKLRPELGLGFMGMRLRY